MNDKKKDKKNLIAGFSILLTLILGVIYEWNYKREMIMIIAGITLILFTCVVEVYGILQYFEKYIKPQKESKPIIISREERRKKDIYGRVKANDMYGVCKIFLREYYVSRFLIIGFVCAMIMVIYQLQFDTSLLPYWAPLLIATVYALGLGSIMVYKISNHKSVDELRRVVEKSGFEPMRVNDDFMLGTYHYLLKGLLTIGQSYYVIFDESRCYVGEVSDIKMAIGGIAQEGNVRVNGVPAKIDRFVLKIYRNNATTIELMCMDYIALKYMLIEFSKLGIDTNF